MRLSLVEVRRCIFKLFAERMKLDHILLARYVSEFLRGLCDSEQPHFDKLVTELLD